MKLILNLVNTDIRLKNGDIHVVLLARKDEKTHFLCISAEDVSGDMFHSLTYSWILKMETTKVYICLTLNTKK